MRLLLIHNYYGSDAPSGENVAFDAERKMLLGAGHEIQVYTRTSDEIRESGFLGLVRGGLATPWNFISARRVRSLVQNFNPHVVHVHNTFPLISPSIFPATKGAARVLTLHNYRLMCPAGIPLRRGKTCTQCLDKRSVLPSIAYGCYRGSRFATTPVALNVAIQRIRRTWLRDVEAFIALTHFQRDQMVAAGLPADRVHVKGNCYPGEPTPVEWEKRRPEIVFAGRLGEEKGVATLLKAWIRLDPSAGRLLVAGDGPLREQLKALVRKKGTAKIEFLGQVPPALAQELIRSCRLLVVPSTCLEGFPMVIREAFAFGTPLLVSDRGSLPELVSSGAGVVFRAGDELDLADKLSELITNDKVLVNMSRLGRATYERLYTERVNYEALMRIYGEALRRVG